MNKRRRYQAKRRRALVGFWSRKIGYSPRRAKQMMAEFAYNSSRYAMGVYRGGTIRVPIVFMEDRRFYPISFTKKTRRNIDGSVPL